MIFSPTGGTQKVADAMTEQWHGEVLNVDLSDARKDFSFVLLGNNDLVMIAVPSYGGRVPAIAAQRIKEIQGNGARCVIVCVYGNRAYEDTLVELYDLAEQCHFRVIAAVSAIAEHSIVREYASGRPDEADQQELGRFAETIFKKLSNNIAADSPLNIPGNRPYKSFGGVGLVPVAGETCTGCGQCAEHCPVLAISREDSKIVDARKCISCMRCVKICPQSARKLKDEIVSAVTLALKPVCSTRKKNELFL